MKNRGLNQWNSGVCLDFRQQSVVIIILNLYQKPTFIQFGAFIH